MIGSCFPCPEGCDLCKKRSNSDICLKCSKGYGEKLSSTLAGTPSTVSITQAPMYNLCALCVSIQNCQAKIVLRRCDKKEFEAKQIVSDNEMIDSLITSDEIADESHPQEDLEDHKIGTYFYTDIPIEKDITVVSQREGSIIEEIAANVQSNEDTNMNIDESSFEDVEESILLTDGSFEIFENGSQKGKHLLLHNGFSYTVKQTRKCN
ncbi:DgyrCDS14477 [Dimorphilus gyrociliatus]|uniref:DgyrCDS14477 n=1 Tax=Dimorphilus gyrociliatus TaxID=2664684 RepID=A0A7I8WDS1_9ANNE|nr:DgyrCDS14477 [Dimorphilus gyrociliatus]